MVGHRDQIRINLVKHMLKLNQRGFHGNCVWIGCQLKGGEIEIDCFFIFFFLLPFDLFWFVKCNFLCKLGHEQKWNEHGHPCEQVGQLGSLSPAKEGDNERAKSPPKLSKRTQLAQLGPFSVRGGIHGGEGSETGHNHR